MPSTVPDPSTSERRTSRFSGTTPAQGAANSNPSMAELVHRNGVLFARNRRLTVALARLKADAATSLSGLTPRQRQVMALVLDGHPSKNIAADLKISQRTVESHRAAIMRRTGATSLPAFTRLSLALA